MKAISCFFKFGAVLTIIAAGIATLSSPAIAKKLASAAACDAPAELVRLDHPLPRTERRLAAGLPLTIVAIGSSSTAGAGASSPAMSYPSRLEVELRQQFPRQEIRVINQGANGEDAREMLARWDESVVANNPDLVIWQVGTNS